MKCVRLAEELVKEENLRDEVVIKKDGKWVAVLGTEETGKHKKAVTLRLSASREPETSSRQLALELLKTPEMEVVMPDTYEGWIEVLGVTTISGPRWNPVTFTLTANMGNGPGVVEYHEWEDDP